MKSLVTSTIIIIVLLAIWGFMYNFILESQEEFNSLVNTMENEVIQENWKATKPIYDSINTKWEKKQKVFLLITAHEEIEKINLTLDKIKKYILIEDKALTLNETSSLKFFLNHIEEKESLSLKNIF